MLVEPFIFPFFYSPILSYSVLFSVALSLSLSFFCSRPYFQPAWLAAALWRLPSGGPFVGAAFGGIKKAPPSSSLFLPPSTLLLSVLLGLIVWKEREVEGGKRKRGKGMFRQASLLCLCPNLSRAHLFQSPRRERRPSSPPVQSLFPLQT